MKRTKRYRKRCLQLVLAVLAGAAANRIALAKEAIGSDLVTECLGYYTLSLPGPFEYALMPVTLLGDYQFKQGLGAWGTDIRVNLDGGDRVVEISREAVAEDLATFASAKNAAIQRKKNELADQLAETRRESLKELYASQLAQTHEVEAVPNQAAIYLLDESKLNLYALVNGHILATELKLQSTPQQTSVFF